MSDRCLEPGEKWDERIKQELEAAHIVVFLVSARFEATDYIRAVEIARAVARGRKRECRVVPVVLELCDWTHSPLKDFNALPAKAHPIRDARPQRNAWYEVQQKLRALLETVGEELRGDRDSESRTFQ